MDRRALYTEWQRTFLHPSLATLDAPTHEECTVNRANSNTPLQSLVLLNDPIFVEAARVFAQNALLLGGATFDRQLRWAFERALNRAPNAQESRLLKDLHASATFNAFNHPNWNSPSTDARNANTFGKIAVGPMPRTRRVRTVRGPKKID